MTKQEFNAILVRCFVKCGATNEKADYIVHDEFKDNTMLVCDIVIKLLWMNETSEDADTRAVRRMVNIVAKTCAFSFD